MRIGVRDLIEHRVVGREYLVLLVVIGRFHPGAELQPAVGRRPGPGNQPARVQNKVEEPFGNRRHDNADHVVHIRAFVVDEAG